MKTFQIIAAGLLCAALLNADTPPATPATKPKAFPSVETKDLHNAHRVTEKVVSGAAPETEQAFEDLRALGVVTIISVDGSTPDAEMARKYGMRYVHLPITYGGVTPAQGQSIAKAIDELPGPVYVHCHHGKHRSAAALAVACVMNGQIKPEQAVSVLETFGTGPNYLGLWKSAREAKPLEKMDLDALKVDYVEKAKIADLARQMVAVDMHWDHLKAIQKNAWKAPKDHPDLDPAHEALQLQEHFRESARAKDFSKRPDDFRKLMIDSDKDAESLHNVLSAKPIDAALAEASFKRVGASCAACHEVHRD